MKMNFTKLWMTGFILTTNVTLAMENVSDFENSNHTQTNATTKCFNLKGLFSKPTESQESTDAHKAQQQKRSKELKDALSALEEHEKSPEYLAKKAEADKDYKNNLNNWLNIRNSRPNWSYLGQGYLGQ